MLTGARLAHEMSPTAATARSRPAEIRLAPALPRWETGGVAVAPNLEALVREELRRYAARRLLNMSTPAITIPMMAAVTSAPAHDWSDQSAHFRTAAAAARRPQELATSAPSHPHPAAFAYARPHTSKSNSEAVRGPHPGSAPLKTARCRRTIGTGEPIRGSETGRGATPLTHERRPGGD